MLGTRLWRKSLINVVTYNRGMGPAGVAGSGDHSTNVSVHQIGVLASLNMDGYWMTRIQFSIFNLPDTSSIISRILVHPDKQIRLNWLMMKTSFGACQRLRITSIFKSE